MGSLERSSVQGERKLIHRRSWFVIFLTLFFLFSLPSQEVSLAPASPTSLLAWSQVNLDGFGAAANDTAWSMAVYENKLYAGVRNLTSGASTWRRDGETTSWVSNKPPSWVSNANSAIPSMMASWDGRLIIGTQNSNGAGVWQYDGISWIQINNDGFGTILNTHVWTLYPWTGTYIVAGTTNSSGTRVLWHQAGTTWLQMNANGFGDPNNTSATSMAEMKDMDLVVGTWNWITGGEVWRDDGGSWSQINLDGFGSSNNLAVRSMAIFDGWLYAGTYNSEDGAQIWRNNQTDNSWQKVADSGFDSPHNIGISVLYRMERYLFAGTENTTDGAQIWRTADGLHWDKVMTGGFGDANNTEIPSLVGFGHQLFAGTRNLVSGAEVWRSLPLGENPAFQVSFDPGDARYPAAAFNSTSGEYLVAWATSKTYSDIITIRILDDSGQPTGSPVVIASEAGEHIVFYSDLLAAYDSHNDRYLVMWIFQAPGSTSIQYLRAQLVDTDGDPVGGLLELKSVDPGLSGFELKGLVYSPVSRDYVLLYALTDPDGTGFRLDAMTIDESGPLEVDEIWVRWFTQTDNLRGADLAWNHAHNECLAVWSETGGSDSEVYARRIELATPDALAGQFLISTDRDLYFDDFPSVAAIGSSPPGTGTYLVAWGSFDRSVPANEWNPDIMGRKVDGDGALAGETFPISALPAMQHGPAVAASDELRTYLAAYGTDYWSYWDWPYYHGRFLPNVAAYVGDQRWLGGGEIYHTGMGELVAIAGGGGDFLVLKSYQAPNASFDQVWATLINFQYQVFIPLIRR
jgi:hypothetical protein